MSVFLHPGAKDGRVVSGTFIEECYERAVFDRDASCAAGWLKEIREKWAGCDQKRMKALAVITLKKQCNWTFEEIAIALGYSDHAGARYALSAAIRHLQREYATLVSPGIYHS